MMCQKTFFRWFQSAFSRSLIIFWSIVGVCSKFGDTEQRIVERVKSNTVESNAFLETTVNINSGTMNPLGVQKVGKLYQQFLEELGFTTRWVEMPASINM